MDLSVSRSQSDGSDVLCVSDARTEQEAGRYDRRSGRLVVADQARVYEVVQALWDFLAVAADADADRACPPCADGPHPGAPGGSGACVAVEVRAAPDAADVPGTGERPEPDEPGLRAARVWPAPDLPHPALGPAPALGAKGRGGRLVDRRLGRLRRDGWAVLSPGGRGAGAVFDRLVIGPPGVFAITFTYADDALVRSHDAESAARMLSAASGMVIKVTPMIAFVGAGAGAGAGTGEAYPRPGREEPPGGVLIARGEDIAEVLWALPAVYSIQERKQISDIARRAELWRAA